MKTGVNSRGMSLAGCKGLALGCLFRGLSAGFSSSCRNSCIFVSSKMTAESSNLWPASNRASFATRSSIEARGSCLSSLNLSVSSLADF